ncbi:MAG TPA: aminotransferase class V-fold PLP-dependent enzyme [Solirubrobacterales bacterium]|nr:aminotransferase class V-fold PLP-dependent enzyme [Solirubrobacterales bacterium]
MTLEQYERVLEVAEQRARRYLAEVEDRPVREQAAVKELRAHLDRELPEEGEDPATVVEELAEAAEPGLIALGSPRYFGFVIGGTLPAALGAEWLTTAWDQIASLYVCGPSASVAEEISGRWVLEVLGLPTDAGYGLTTGGTMANFSGIAAGRRAVLARRDWDVEAKGLNGAPPVRVLVGEHAHATIFVALRLLGLGDENAIRVRADDAGRMDPDALAAELERGEGPAIVCSQAGEVNTGCFDPFPALAEICKQNDAWLHVDGAVGLWAAASHEFDSLTEGLERADSWSTDAHKWLNVPYDCGFIAVKDAEHLRGAMGIAAPYLTAAPDARDSYQYVPESSRRARGFPLYAALRSLGRKGVADLIERTSAHARLMAEELGADPALEVLNEVVINQVLVGAVGDDSGELTADAVERIQQDGTCWLAGTRWRGRPAIRISVCNWQTSEDDIRRSAVAIREAVLEASAA